ncbi:MAG TPA: methyl-accepting chemotaxis protein, partial [Humisphaera sp.]
MLRIKNLSIRTKLYAITGLAVGAVVVVAAVGWRTIEATRVNGPADANIKANMTLQGDVLPPPLYLVESFATALDLNNASDPAQVARLTERLRALRKDYDDRHRFWAASLSDPQLKQAVVVRNHEAATRFFDCLEQEYLPLVRAGNRSAAAAVLGGRLRACYEAQRASVDEIVGLTNAALAAESEQVATAARRREMLMVGLCVGLAAATLVVTLATMRRLARWFGDAERVLAGVGRGELNQELPDIGSDEAGRLSKSMNAMIGSVRVNLSQAKEAATNSEAVSRVLVALANAKDATEAASLALATVRDAFGWAYGSF